MIYHVRVLINFNRLKLGEILGVRTKFDQLRNLETVWSHTRYNTYHLGKVPKMPNVSLRVWRTNSQYKMREYFSSVNNTIITMIKCTLSISCIGQSNNFDFLLRRRVGMNTSIYNVCCA